MNVISNIEIQIGLKRKCVEYFKKRKLEPFNEKYKMTFLKPDYICIFCYFNRLCSIKS